MDKNVVFKMYVEERKSIRSIAKELKTNYHAVRNAIDKFKIEKRSRSEALKGKIVSDETRKKQSLKRNKNCSMMTEEFLRQKYIEEKLSTDEIGNLIGCYASTVARRLNEFKMIRSTGESLVLRGTMKGPNNSFYGRQHSEETKDKISIAKIGTPALKGSDNPSWKGGTTKLQKLIRSSKKYYYWRTFCFVRDDFTCKECEYRGGKLNVDHIKPLSIILQECKLASLDDALNCKELWDFDNGRTLCVSCHKKTETYGTKALNYKEVVV